MLFRILHSATFLSVVLLFARDVKSVNVTSRSVNDTTYSQDGLSATQHTASLRIKDNVYGVRDVNYWVTNQGEAIIDGDVVYGTVEKLFSHSYAEDNDHGSLDVSSTKRAYSVFRGAGTWPNALVQYRYDSNETREALNSRFVRGAMVLWTSAVASLNLFFSELPVGNFSETGVLLISMTPNRGCIATTGYGSGDGLIMNLQQGGCGQAEALHELGHVLGLHHEHQRPDRDQSIRFNCENVNLECMTMPAGATCCPGQIHPAECCNAVSAFDTFGGGDMTGMYDASSVMHYTSGAFSNPGSKTLTSLGPDVVINDIGPTEITRLDARRICELYNSDSPTSSRCMELVD